MIILNLIWKFSTGGIGKCFQVYDKMGEERDDIKVVSVCIDPQNCQYDRTALVEMGAEIISIKNIFDLSWTWKMKRLIGQVAPDVIFCHGFNGPVVVQTVLGLYNLHIPMVCSYHGLYHAPTKAKRWIAPFFNHVQTYLYKTKASKIILVENYSKRYLLNAGVSKDKLYVVHNGIPDTGKSQKAVNLPEGAVSIGLSSRLDKVKGIEYAIQAIPMIKKHAEKPFHFYILGDGPLEKKLKDMVTAMHLQDFVTMVGYAENVGEWMTSWDIFCLPSLFEYHSIALLEAMRGGKAIVATNVGGNEESVTHGKEAIVVNPKDIEGLALALTRFINDEQLRIEYGRNARKRYLEEFTESKMKEGLINVFLKK